MARQYHIQTGHPRKFKVIGTYGSYHGGTMGALSATGGWDRKSIFEPLMPGFLHIHPADAYECQYGHTRGRCGEDDARMLERMIQAEDPETVSSVIMSPVLISSAGFIVPPRDYFQHVRKICDRYRVLLIFDEIITGFGRLGTMFGADYFEVVPDFICCGKGMSSGYAPLAAVLLKDSVNEAFLGEPGRRQEFHHGHTYGGNPVSCAAGVAAMQELLDRDLVRRAAEMGAYLRTRLERIAEGNPLVADLRGIGLLQGYQFIKRQDTSGPPIGNLVGQAARERGMLLRAGEDFIALAPPLVVTAEEIDEMCAVLDESLQAVTAAEPHATEA
jgi:adenosylmethionine-8-amino-7-oxononanoate aminotransferase